MPAILLHVQTTREYYNTELLYKRYKYATKHYTIKWWVHLGKSLCLVLTVHSNLLVAATNFLDLKSDLVFLTLGDAALSWRWWEIK